VTDLEGLGFYFGGDGTIGTLERVDVNNLHSYRSGRGGRGLMALSGAQVHGREVLIDDVVDFGVFVDGGETSLILEDSTVRDTRGSLTPGTGIGLISQDSARVELWRTTISGSHGPGLYVASGARVQGDDVTSTDNGFASAVMLGGTLILRDSRLTASRIHPARGGGLGLFTMNFHEPPIADFQRVEFSGHPGPAVYLRDLGGWLFDEVVFDASDSMPLVPAAVMAVDGVPARYADLASPGGFYGLFLRDSAVLNVPLHAVLLHASAAEFNEMDLGGSFESMVHAQRCDDAPNALAGDVPSGFECSTQVVEVAPRLFYDFDVGTIDLEL
jgi:hypothetical protein